MGSPQWPKARNVPQGRKVEPKANAMNVRAVSQIGTSLGNHVMEQGKILPRNKIAFDVHKGRGFEAPAPVGVHIHKCGSQGES